MKSLRDVSLKTRIALAVSALFVICVGVIAAWALALFEAEKKASLSAQAYGMVSVMAENIDSKLLLLHKTIIQVAAAVPPRALEDGATAQAFLDRQTALHALFDNGLFLVSMDSKLVAESPFKPDRRGRDLSIREFVQQTITSRKPYISKPFRSAHNPGQPAIVMTAPVFNQAGIMIGQLHGSIDLLGSNVLADLAKVRLGKTGYMYLGDGRETMISHPDKDRIMGPLAKKGQNLIVDRVLDQNWEGAGETVTSLDIPMLAAARRLKSTGWIIGANLPLTEFYTPIREARNYFLLSIALGTLAILFWVWLLAYRLISPLSEMTQQVMSMLSKPNSGSRLTISSRDEIGVMATAFNQMLEKLSSLNAELESRMAERMIAFEALTAREAELHRSETKFRALYDSTSDAVMLMDEKGFFDCNKGALAMFGCATREELWAKHPVDLSPPQQSCGTDSMTLANRYIATAMEKGQHNFEWMHRRVDSGEVFSADVLLSALELDGKPVLQATVRDISSRKRVEADLHLAAIAFDSQEAVVITDANEIILKVNHAFSRITGYGAAQAIGTTLGRLLKSGRQDAQFYHEMWESLDRDRYWQGELWNRRKNGEIYPEWLNITAVTNEEGKVTNYVASFTDITQRKQAEETIHNLAFYDPLTDLPNRRLLHDRLKHTLASNARHRNHGAILFIDLDNFKTLNDTKGHGVGDLLLVEVARRLQSCVRAEDTVARLGGDEFVIILDDLSEEPEQAAIQAEVIAEKMHAAINQPFMLQGQEYHGSSSIGINLFRGRDITSDELLKRADIAMYQAKESGRNAIRFFDPAVHAAMEARIALEADLRYALSRNQLRLYYQKQVDHRGSILSAEVLLRWQHPVRGLVLPAQFILMAEETGLIVPIGHWVLETACQQLKVWESDPNARYLPLAVNVSARQFRQPDFVEQVRGVLDRTAIDPGRLKLELTESLVLDNINDTITKMQALKDIGVRFSMDDFGTGYSSLAYLSQLPLDQVKIDQSFVSNIGIKSSNEVIVQTIIGMANNLGLNVIAEGVETEVQRDFLERNGCPACQGYLFGQPMPVDEFERKLNQQAEATSLAG